MKVVILAGGLGTRLSEYTHSIPKPMIDINGKPMIYYIMKHYAKSGFKNFYVAIGYKGNVIRKFFKKKSYGWNINLIDTGKNTMTGGRLKRLKKYLGKGTFMMTYGDGISNVNLKKLLNFHKKNKKLITLTAVRPPARFGFVKIRGNNVFYFKEKSKTEEGWINGGFFVVKPKYIDMITRDSTFLEREPLEKATKMKQRCAFTHTCFWKGVQTIRELGKLKMKIKKN